MFRVQKDLVLQHDRNQQIIPLLSLLLSPQSKRRHLDHKRCSSIKFGNACIQNCRSNKKHPAQRRPVPILASSMMPILKPSRPQAGVTSQRKVSIPFAKQAGAKSATEHRTPQTPQRGNMQNKIQRMIRRPKRGLAHPRSYHPRSYTEEKPAFPRRAKRRRT